MTTPQSTNPRADEQHAQHVAAMSRMYLARLRLVNDARLGLISPPWVLELADLERDGMPVPRMRRRFWWGGRWKPKRRRRW